MIELGANRYGKSATHLGWVVSDVAGHRVRDVTAAVAREGDFHASPPQGVQPQVSAPANTKHNGYTFCQSPPGAQV